MTHSNLYKDRTLDNGSPGSSLAYTGSHPSSPEVVQCDRKWSKNSCKINFFHLLKTTSLNIFNPKTSVLAGGVEFMEIEELYHPR